MIIPRHPDLMTDEELREWLHRLISSKSPESVFLDYKETISTDSRSDKREIAKDISSFANERGGVILYGVPEERRNDEPIPGDIGSVGIDPIPGLPQILEDVLVGALTPRLPELRVREIPVDSSTGEVVYFVWHPESWEAPHMIHAYGEHRYYRRGNYRAVLMEEGEVERLYSKRQARRTLASEFFREGDFGEQLLPQEKPLMRIVVCPAFPFESRVDFTTETMREWLRKTIPYGGPRWYPFVDGVRFYARLGGERQEEYRFFQNGAASFCSDAAAPTENRVSGRLFLFRQEDFFKLVGAFYDQIGMAGEVFIEITLLSMQDVEFEIGLGGIPLWPDRDNKWHHPVLRFRVPASALEMTGDQNRWTLETRIMDRLVQCFGIWNVPQYFNDDGSPR